MDLRLDFKNLGFDPQSVIVLGAIYNDPNYPNHHFRQGVDSLPVPEKVLASCALAEVELELD
ncbi:hypothetical protein LEP1GSC085_2296 [Leptospira interrogans str. L0996]|nr:hypothetical protein LEP1GSC085_2296 [Leptospira interrogans str. L0996]